MTTRAGNKDKHPGLVDLSESQRRRRHDSEDATRVDASKGNPKAATAVEDEVAVEDEDVEAKKVSYKTTSTMAANDVLPFVPSVQEAENRYYGLPSRPYFVARSSQDIWASPTGMEAYIQPRELRRVGMHALCNIWEGRVGVAMHTFLVEQKVCYTSIDPVRVGIANEPAAPIIIWVGVEPGSLSAERGLEVAIGLRALLLENDIEDVHVEIRESVVTSSAKMYRPAPTSNHTVQVQEAFSTALGIAICAEKTPHIQGTVTLSLPSLPCQRSSSSSQPNTFFSLSMRIMTITSTTTPCPAGMFCYWVRTASMLVSRTSSRRSKTPRLLSTTSGIGWSLLARWRTRSRHRLNGKMSCPSWKRERERSHSSRSSLSTSRETGRTRRNVLLATSFFLLLSSLVPVRAASLKTLQSSRSIPPKSMPVTSLEMPLTLAPKSLSRPLPPGCILTAPTNLPSSTLLAAFSSSAATFQTVRCIDPTPVTSTTGVTPPSWSSSVAAPLGSLSDVSTTSVHSIAKPPRPSLVNIQWGLRCCLARPNLAHSLKVETLAQLSLTVGVLLLVCLQADQAHPMWHPTARMLPPSPSSSNAWRSTVSLLISSPWLPMFLLFRYQTLTLYYSNVYMLLVTYFVTCSKNCTSLRFETAIL